MSFLLSQPSLPPRTCKWTRVCAHTASRVKMIWLRALTSAVWSKKGRPLASGFLRGVRRHSGCWIELSGYCYKSIALHTHRTVLPPAPWWRPQLWWSSRIILAGSLNNPYVRNFWLGSPRCPQFNALTAHLAFLLTSCVSWYIIY